MITIADIITAINNTLHTDPSIPTGMLPTLQVLAESTDKTEVPLRSFMVSCDAAGWGHFEITLQGSTDIHTFCPVRQTDNTPPTTVTVTVFKDGYEPQTSVLSSALLPMYLRGLTVPDSPEPVVPDSPAPCYYGVGHMAALWERHANLNFYNIVRLLPDPSTVTLVPPLRGYLVDTVGDGTPLLILDIGQNTRVQVFADRGRLRLATTIENVVDVWAANAQLTFTPAATYIQSQDFPKWLYAVGACARLREISTMGNLLEALYILQASNLSWHGVAVGLEDLCAEQPTAPLRNIHTSQTELEGVTALHVELTTGVSAEIFLLTPTRNNMYGIRLNVDDSAYRYRLVSNGLMHSNTTPTRISHNNLAFAIALLPENTTIPREIPT